MSWESLPDYHRPRHVHKLPDVRTNSYKLKDQVRCTECSKVYRKVIIYRDYAWQRVWPFYYGHPLFWLWFWVSVWVVLCVGLIALIMVTKP